jgi:uncharacterized membrane protein YbhN (UPF0104 family)
VTDPTDPDASESTVPHRDEVGATPPRHRLRSALITIVVLFVVFGLVLPSIVDYQTIWDSLKSLTLANVAVLLLLTAFRTGSEALVYRAMLPGLRLWPGSQAYLSSSAVTMLPPPAPSVVQYAYFRSEEFDADDALTGAAGTFVFPQAGRLLLPVVAFIALVVAGQADETAMIVVGISILALAIAGVLAWFIGRSEESARWIGGQLARVISWVLHWFHRDPVDDLGPGLVRMRDLLYDVVKRRWGFGAAAVAGNLLISFLMLLAAIRFLGVSTSDVSTVVIFASFAAAFLAGTLIPISAGGIGVVDIVMITSIVKTTGVDTDVIVAAVLVWRIFYDVVTLPIGALTLSSFSRKHRDLLRGAQQTLTSGDDPDTSETRTAEA